MHEEKGQWGEAVAGNANEKVQEQGSTTHLSRKLVWWWRRHEVSAIWKRFAGVVLRSGHEWGGQERNVVPALSVMAKESSDGSEEEEKWGRWLVGLSRAWL
jgi:hypothetical protein